MNRPAPETLEQTLADDLVALTPEAAAITNLPYEPGHRTGDEALRRKVG